jgi:hypothetical protein
MPNVVPQNIPLVGKNKLAKKLHIVLASFIITAIQQELSLHDCITSRQPKRQIQKNISIIKTLL